jgi:hypothetical protein
LIYIRRVCREEGASESFLGGIFEILALDDLTLIEQLLFLFWLFAFWGGFLIPGLLSFPFFWGCARARG